MNENTPLSDTFQIVDETIDFSGPYHDAALLMYTPSARIYRISKAGKTMLLKTPLDDSGRSLDLLKREYRLGVGLSHQHIAAIYTWETQSPVGPGILMEFVDGRTLASFLQENPSISVRRRVFEQLLDAVNYIHKHGITHNDLKPGNIMVSRANNDVKIIDFGLADSDGETCQRQLGGTIGYASPELSKRDASADMRSDIYSIGIIMQDIFGRRFRSISQKCIHQNPRNRYANIDSLIKAWRWRKKRPSVISSLVGALVFSAIVLFGIVKIGNLTNAVDHYSLSSRQMADTIAVLRQNQTMALDSIATLRQNQTMASDSISALRLNQTMACDSISTLRIHHTTATDSIAKLNVQLSQINHDKAVNDSIANAYIASAKTVIDKYKSIIRKLRCREETYILYDRYNADMDRNDSLFLRKNALHGKEIYDKYGISMRMQGTKEIEQEAKKLPSIHDLTTDSKELNRLLPLILNGKPWKLNSDPK